ncbi:MAG: Gfo/Idh/MocA family oxidoreductase [Gemmatimonadaceae bacterium]|nr:Gfo/Idh/MocA family oxidoreductase [Gemmatimonadaceae bacterium]
MTSEFEFPRMGEAPDLDLSVAVVGCGSIGRRHIQTLLKQGPRIVGVDPLDVPLPDSVQHYRTLREAGKVDAVLVCTPASDRIRIIREALAMGAHLFIEKPLAMTYAEAEEIAALVAEYPHRKVMLGYNLRFDPDLQTFAAQLPDLGRLMYAQVRCSSYLPRWRPGRDYSQTPSARAALGGGILREASHELDLINWLFSPKSVAIGASMRKVSDLDIDCEDLVAATLETETGLVIELHLDFITPGYSRGIRVVGTKGEAEWRLGPESPMYEREIAHFLDCVVNNKKPAVGIGDGLRAMELDQLIRAASAAFDEARGRLAA